MHRASTGHAGATLPRLAAAPFMISVITSCSSSPLPPLLHGVSPPVAASSGDVCGPLVSYGSAVTLLAGQWYGDGSIGRGGAAATALPLSLVGVCQQYFVGSSARSHYV